MGHIKCCEVISAPRKEVFSYMMEASNWPMLYGNHGLEIELEERAEKLGKDSIYKLSMTRFGLNQLVTIRVLDLVYESKVTYKQVEGLFEKWVHSLHFEDHGKGETLVTDFVEFSLPYGLFGTILSDLWVRRDMQMILKERLDKVSEHFRLRT